MPTYTTHYDLAKPLVNNPIDEDLWGGELNENMDKIDDALYAIATAGGGATVPTGALFDFAGTTAPAGYLLCYGQTVSRTTYADLFTAIGTTWGAGDGSTTFGIPDFRGRIAAGKDDMGGSAANRLTSTTMTPDGVTIGAVGGSQTHTLTSAQLASHSHTITVDAASAAATFRTQEAQYSSAGTTADIISLGPTPAVASTAIPRRGDSGQATVSTLVSTGTHTHTASASSTGSDAAHNNVQPTAIVLKIIKT